MQNFPSLPKVKAIAAQGQYRALPVHCEILSDFLTPIEALRILKNVSTHCYLLESALARREVGAVHLLGYDPQAGDHLPGRGDEGGGPAVFYPGSRRLSPPGAGGPPQPPAVKCPPFTGGLVGYFSYDYLAYQEPTAKCDVPDSEAFQDVDLMLFDKVIAFDHLRQKIVLMVNMPLEDVEVHYNKGGVGLEQMVLLRTGEKKAEPAGLTGPVTPLFDRAAFCRMVEEAKGYIREGDLFQIVLSNRLSAPFTGSLLNTYRMLRTINPSPYMFYFSGTDVEVAGASRRPWSKLEDGVTTFPLAGTRPRGETMTQDQALEAELLDDDKELAEHDMLVDLGRNDLGKVSRFGTVAVEQCHTIQRFSHVMHIGSTIRGELRQDRDALDAVAAVLPAGTLSGAPKIRACQRIGQLEGNKRGIYGGAIGYLDFTGNLDTCIAIRIAYQKNGRVFVRSRAGIVADSVPPKPSMRSA